MYHPAAVSRLWIKNQMGEGEEVGREVAECRPVRPGHIPEPSSWALGTPDPSPSRPAPTRGTKELRAWETHSLGS